MKVAIVCYATRKGAVSFNFSGLTRDQRLRAHGHIILKSVSQAVLHTKTQNGYGCWKLVDGGAEG